jgi:hypothetical protein
MEENLWHLRLGHPSPATLKNLATAKVIPLDPSLVKRENNYVTCASAQQITKPIAKQTKDRAKTRGERFFSDVCGPILKASQVSYFSTYRNDATKFIFVSLIKLKSEVHEKMDYFLTFLKNQFDITPKKIRTDRGGEYTSNEIEKTLKLYGIIYKLTVSDTPQENGVSERLNDLIMRKA